MRVRVRFSKFGCARFIGHLDIMRYFQKAFRRAGLPIAYSSGFHPHPILSFAQPLSLSYTSDGEYFDVELTEAMSEEELFDSLQSAMCEDIRISKVSILRDFQLNEKKTTGMSLISGAYYAISLDIMPVALKDNLKSFMDCKEYIVEKTTKNGTKECNLREGVYDIKLYCKGAIESIYISDSFSYTDEELKASIKNASLYQDTALLVSLDAGSERNISAELFLNGILRYSGLSEESVGKSIHRMDLFGNKGGKRVPLWMIES